MPVGTVALDPETHELVADLARPGDEHIVARGGKGGLGNMHFATSTRQAPLLQKKGSPDGSARFSWS